MSSDSLAMFRRRLGPDLGALAEQHLQHEQSDRDTLNKAASAVKSYATYGTAIGGALGLLLAYRIRANRTRIFTALRTVERPTHLKFADGREQALPDITPALKPSLAGDFLTYTFLGFGGLFLGGELGLVTGSFRARQHVLADPESRQRIEAAFRGFQADALRTQANLIEQAGKEGRSLASYGGDKWL
ncbi:hypothetical protein AMS68_006705 [Peltaster fructicola]|uniref:Uncharacterized protein n=1 Tax=Peltaster fructicola TaxID=286661 RepID=A0A6H0Y2V9_9PEZI|nr:hypothetical protein AMS68_006705 [Peltaster fructicola]